LNVFKKIAGHSFFFRQLWRFADPPFSAILAVFDTLRSADAVSFSEALAPNWLVSGWPLRNSAILHF
jgi:hypothetical protein